MNLNFAEAPAMDALNLHMCDVAYDSPLPEQGAYSASSELTSTDIVGTSEQAIFDFVATTVLGNSCVLSVRYDNDYGSSVQVPRVMQRMFGMQLPALPA